MTVANRIVFLLGAGDMTAALGAATTDVEAALSTLLFVSTVAGFFSSTTLGLGTDLICAGIASLVSSTALIGAASTTVGLAGDGVVVIVSDGTADVAMLGIGTATGAAACTTLGGA